MLLHALPLLAILPLSLAKTIAVDVGKGDLVFSPDTITAEKGDSIVFTFYPDSHTVVESTFDKPCIYKSGGISSGTGFQTTSGASSKTFTVNIDNSDTRWLYCSIGNHCQKGMALVINQKDQSLKDYKAASGTVTSTNNNPTVSGGTVSDKSGTSSASSSVAAKATSATTASASSASASASSASSSSGTAASITSSSSASRASATSASATATAAANKVGAGAALGIAGMLLGGLI